MVWKRAAATGVVLAAAMMAGLAGGGCQNQRATPAASAAVPPVDEATAASLEQSYRQAHPDALIGHVNAVAPDRHIVSVAGLPLDQIHRGDVVTILIGGQANSAVSGRVYDKASGFVQMDYGLGQAGQQNPRVGDLAVRFPNGESVPPTSTEMQPAAGGSPVTVSPATTQPAAGAAPEIPTAPATTPPTPPPAPPATSPAPSGADATPTTPATPATTPATPPAGETGTTTTTTTPPPPPPAPDAGGAKGPADLNK